MVYGFPFLVTITLMQFEDHILKSLLWYTVLFLALYVIRFLQDLKYVFRLDTFRNY